MRNRLTRVLPWVVAAGIFVYLFSRISPAEVARAAAGAAPWMVPALAVVVVLVYLADSLAIWKTFGWFLTPLSFKDVLVVRGASYLLAIINYTVGQGAIVYFVNRARGVPVTRGAGAVLLIMGINVLLLLMLATIGVFAAPDVPVALPTVVAIGWAGLVVYAAIVAWRPRFLTARPLLEVLLGAGLRGHLRAMAVRAPHVASLLVFNYTSLRAFGVDVPPIQALLYLPIVYFVAVLPISPMGLGTSQGAMVLFFQRYASDPNPQAVVLACSLVAQVLGMAVQAVIGLVCLRNQMARDLARTRPAA